MTEAKHGPLPGGRPPIWLSSSLPAARNHGVLSIRAARKRSRLHSMSAVQGSASRGGLCRAFEQARSWGEVRADGQGAAGWSGGANDCQIASHQQRAPPLPAAGQASPLSPSGASPAARRLRTLAQRQQDADHQRNVRAGHAAPWLPLPARTPVLKTRAAISSEGGSSCAPGLAANPKVECAADRGSIHAATLFCLSVWRLTASCRPVHLKRAERRPWRPVAMTQHPWRPASRNCAACSLLSARWARRPQALAFRRLCAPAQPTVWCMTRCGARQAIAGIGRECHDSPNRLLAGLMHESQSLTRPHGPPVLHPAAPHPASCLDLRRRRPGLARPACARCMSAQARAACPPAPATTACSWPAPTRACPCWRGRWRVRSRMMSPWRRLPMAWAVQAPPAGPPPVPRPRPAPAGTPCTAPPRSPPTFFPTEGRGLGTLVHPVPAAFGRWLACPPNRWRLRSPFSGPSGARAQF